VPTPFIVVVTGASGAGKTTALRALAARGLPGLSCHQFDSIGVPPEAEMLREYGSGEAWQAATMDRWVERLLRLPDTATVLDAQVRPTFAEHSFRRSGVSGRVVLLDCTPEVRSARLRGGRGQPELDTTRMSMWAAYLRGQADALHMPVIDSSTLDPEAIVDQLLALIRVEAAV
jgi:broad-specificity NMP kinase